MNCKHFSILISILFSCLNITAQNRASWMKQARWGIMIHYLADWRSRTDSINTTSAIWNETINHFDVEGLAQQIKSTGAGYLIFTIGQNSGYYVAPNKTYERITGITGKCSQRDLITDLSAALKKHGIKLIVYLPSGAPGGDSIARKALKWENGPKANREFQLNWEAIIRDWSLCWGKKIDGWWFDGCYWPNIMYRGEGAPNFASFAAAARAGNLESIVAFNPGVVYRTLSITPYEDYVAGEVDKPEFISIKRSYEGKVDGKQIHVLSFLGKTWGMGDPRFTSDQIIGFSNQVVQTDGAITWDTPVQRNGLIAASFIALLEALGKGLRH
jgi:alpha-L-fucosidase-like protein